MEFPELGKNCAWPTCKQLDFLPVTCAHCGLIFCKEHVNADRHDCSGTSDTDATKNKAATKSFACNSENCKDSSAVEMPCQKCGKHFCLLHRHHSCFEMAKEDAEAKTSVWSTSKQHFVESLNNINKIVNEGIKKSMQNPKKQETANRLNLMRLKAKSKGPSGVPMESRLYFRVIPSKEAKSQGTRAIYTSQDWSVGRVIDSVSDMCGLPNQNNVANAKKLRLFKKEDGQQISSDMSVKLRDLIREKAIIDGETLILEYIAPSEDVAVFSLSNHEDYEET